MKISSKIFYFFLSLIILLGCSKDETQQDFRLEVSAEPAEGGSITPSSGTHSSGDEIELKATAASGFVFKEWAGSINSSENPYLLRVNSDKKITAVFTTGETVLKEKLLGKWNIINQESQSNKSSNNKTQESTEECAVLTMVFNSDGSFVIHHSHGTTSGTFSIDTASSVLLGEFGRIDDVLIEEDSISFTLILTEFCSVSGRGNSDRDYSEGDCSSFIDCNRTKIWKREIGDAIEFLWFNKENDEPWMETVRYDKSFHCNPDVRSNSEGYIVVANSVSHLSYLEPWSNETVALIEYSLDSEGSLIKKYDVNSEGWIEIYTSSTTNEFDTYLNFPACSDEKIYIPDDVFEQSLIDLGYDNEMDNYVDTSKMMEVAELDLSVQPGQTEKISNLTGIEDMLALRSLNISGNEIPSVDLSKNERLEILRADNCGIENINLPYPQMTHLYLNNNNIKELQIRKFYELKYLSASRNSLTVLNIEDSPLLIGLYLGENQLQSINLQNNASLTDLDLNDNHITEIDLSKNVKLREIGISKNQLTQLETTTLPELWGLNANRNFLEYIDLSQNQKLEMVYLSENQIFDIKFPTTPKFVELYLNGNNLASLELRNMAFLFEVGLSDNVIDQLNIDNCGNVKILYAQNNLLKSIELSSVHNLEFFNISNNQLSSLDVSNQILHSLNATTNNLSCIKIAESQTTFPNWKVDEGVQLGTSCE